MAKRAAVQVESRRKAVHSMVVGVILMFGLAPAHAIPITLEFTVSDIPPTTFGTEPPVDSVSGVIVYEAAAVGAQIESLTSISLAIVNHSFTLAEISWVGHPSIPRNFIGGLLGGIGGVSHRTSDFVLGFDRCERDPGNFVFAVEDHFGVWRTTNFTSFSLSGAGPVACGAPLPTAPGPEPVPEPGTLGLLMLGLTGALMAGRRILH